MPLQCSRPSTAFSFKVVDPAEAFSALKQSVVLASRSEAQPLCAYLLAFPWLPDPNFTSKEVVRQLRSLDQMSLWTAAWVSLHRPSGCETHQLWGIRPWAPLQGEQTHGKSTFWQTLKTKWWNKALVLINNLQQSCWCLKWIHSC